MKPQFIIIHHSATKRDTTTFEAVNRYHRDKWNFKSSLGYYIGYHYFITADGKITQGRADSDVGAHCYQQNMNYQSLGICLAGWFDTGHDDFPTKAQLNSLIDLIIRKIKEHNLSVDKVKFHRDYAPKSCPGLNITHQFIYNLLKDKNMSCEAEKKQIKELKARILERDATISDFRKKINDRNKKVDELEDEIKKIKREVELATQLVEQKEKVIIDLTAKLKDDDIIEEGVGFFKKLWNKILTIWRK